MIRRTILLSTPPHKQQVAHFLAPKIEGKFHIDAYGTLQIYECHRLWNKYMKDVMGEHLFGAKIYSEDI